MEFMLLLWDEWDDFLGTCHHLMTSAADEFTGISTAIGATASAVGLWIIATQTHVSASLISRATFWIR
jgi:hypothetical protein